MHDILIIAQVVTGAIGALFWFVSASGRLPAMGSYFDGAPPNDPFLVAVRGSASWNRWAALFTGLSMLCQAIGVVA